MGAVMISMTLVSGSNPAASARLFRSLLVIKPMISLSWEMNSTFLFFRVMIRAASLMVVLAGHLRISLAKDTRGWFMS